MSERYSKIEDETFPSFLAESINSNVSETLENCTLTSNLGLPVAASTGAKARSAFERFSDVQESYLESEKNPVTTDSLVKLSHSGGGQSGKFALSFKDNLEDLEAFLGTVNAKKQFQNGVSSKSSTELGRRSLELLPTGLHNDVSSGSSSISDAKLKDQFSRLPPLLNNAQKEMRDIRDEETSSSVASFLENEKLTSIASLESSLSDEELNDEGFSDHELEAYFRQLRPPGMHRGVIEGQELQEPQMVPHMGPLSFSSKVLNEDYDCPEYEDDFEEDFQMLQVRLAATGMDSAPASDDDVELEFEKVAQQPLQREHFLDSATRHLVGEQHRPSFRPGLDGGSSEEETSNERLTVPGVGSALSHRQSAEGHGFGSPRASLVEEFGLGDGSSSGSEDGLKMALNTQNSVSRKEDLNARRVAGEESTASVSQAPVDRIAPIGDGATAKEHKAQSVDEDRRKVFKDNLMHNPTNLDSSHANGAPKLDSLYFMESRTPYNESDNECGTHFSHIFSTGYSESMNYRKSTEPGHVDDTASNLAAGGLTEDYLSQKMFKTRMFQLPLTSGSNLKVQNFQWSFADGGCEKGESQAHSVVYQNEEGKWVTDLAYYKSFENEQSVNVGGIPADDQSNDQDFIAGNDALAMLDEDQEEFEKEHRFIQEEKMDLENLSASLGDTSWKMPVNTNVLLKSQMACDLSLEDASYLRLSLGAFFGQRSEALGCLGGGSDVKRPSFGYHIISPEKQKPIALLSKSNYSGCSENDDTLKFCDTTLTPEDLGCLPDDQKLASATFDVKTPGKLCINKHNEEKYRDSSASDVEAQNIIKELCSELTLNQTSDGTLLSISTIASAIANASCSAEASELAAMILALSNKHKTMNIPLSSLEQNQSASKLLQTSLRNKEPERNIDMEKYLKATVHNGQDTENETFDHSLKDITWNMSLGNMHPLKTSERNQANITDIQKQDLRKPDNSKEVQVGCVNPSSVGKISDGSVKQYTSLGNVNGNSQSTVQVSFSDSSEIPKSKLSTCLSMETSENKNREKMDKPLTIESSAALSAERRSTTATNDFTKYSQPSVGKPSQNVSGSLKSCLQDSVRLKSPRKSNSRFSNASSESKDHKNPCSVRDEASQKHVTFQSSSNGVHHKVNEKKSFAEYTAHAIDEEQFNFRPSTSPLIHSSPSQDSIKISETSNSPERQESVQRFSHSGSSDELSCLSPSLSRLTYVSASDSALQNSTIHSPEKKKINNTIELSTTIVRASPTPAEMQLEKSDHLSWEGKNKQLSRSPSGFRTITGSDTGNNSGDPVQHEKRRSKPESTSSSVNDIGKFPCADYATKASQVTTSANMLQSVMPDKYSVMQSIPSNQCVCISGFKPVVPASDLQTLPSSVPALLSGQSLSSTPFAQQYLGNVNPASVYSGGSYTLYGASTGYPSCSLHTQTIQGAVAGGVSLSANIGQGLLSTLPLNTANQNIDPHINLLEKRPDTTGLSQWMSSRMSSAFGQVLVPEEVTFPSACCVGIASQTSLNIFNPNERWMQVNISVLSIAINGDKIDVGAHQCLIFKNKTIIGPRAAEDIKILLLPQRPGLFQCVLSVSSWPVSADTETIVRAETIASKVLLAAVSEYPLIEQIAGKREGLDFGDLSSGTWKTLPLKLINRTRATVPIRLIISANATAWRCFTFSKDPTNLVKEFAVHADPIPKLSSPSVISHVMHASYDGQDPEYFVIWVVFHAPQAYNSAGPLGPPEEFTARVDIEIDSPGPACMLRSIPLRARAGCARIHAPKDLQTLRLTCNVGSSTKQLLPLKNAGNIAAHLKVKCTNEDGFSIDPEDLFVAPGEEQAVAVIFSPCNSTPKQSILKIMVQPSGPQYEVTLMGDTERPVTKCSTDSTPISSSDVPPILSNKQFMSWGGVGVGRAVQQKLILRSTSATASQHLRLLIRGQDQDCFQLQSRFGPDERLTSSCELTIRPKEDAAVHLMFSPTRVACMLAKLEIKQSAVKSSQQGIKFTIPLSGYGGTSNIILEDVKRLPDSYSVTLNGISPNRVSRTSFFIKNTGSRAAYVKAACFINLEKGIMMDPNVLFLTPDKFVLKEGSKEKVTVSYSVTNQEMQRLQHFSTSVLCTVRFFYGDEVSRQQFRRAVLYKPEMAQKIISEYSKLKSTRFDEEFSGEQMVSEVYDLPQRPNDIQLFYGNMRNMVLSVAGSMELSGSSVPPSLGMGLSSVGEDVEKGISNTTLDILPVKGPQGPHLLSAPLRIGEKSEHTWSVQPEFLLLRPPTTDGLAGTGYIQIHNSTSKSMQFDLSWPAHCLTVTPQHGSIEPQSHASILVSPNPSSSGKQNLLWNGQIYVHCDNAQKIVKVQINDGAPLRESGDRGRKSLPMRSSRLDSPVHVARPQPKASSCMLEIKNRNLVFPRTAAGESSETFLDIENPGDKDLKWLLTSFAPPYVKGVDQSDDIYRATYTVFRCSRVSGVLAAHDQLKVAVTFFPRDQGDYTQFWDLECHPLSEPHLKQKVRFQLCGEGTVGGNVPMSSSGDSLVKTEAPVKPRRRAGSEASSLRAVQDATRGIFASEKLYRFPPTLGGEASTLKVNLQNKTFTTCVLKFVSPKEPFHIKHSKYSLRAQHYLHLPVTFKPSSVGTFEGSLVVQTDAGDICIQLVGEALAKS
ncbi:LOW QUALITY PROTEIN: centrosomal protein of 192 kDa [Hyperolius riggenbachi]|uniref:LOW QUALITY PROTEIN: centrosomal protein of 192 kDa n=1 Tax=Hyperolius riggenbachi TaxID=752182 RepID=UPI0035A35604